MTMQSLRNTKLPSAGVIAGAVQAIVYGGGATYGLYNSLFNVEGGHRAIVYNRVVGVKDKVRARSRAPRAFSRRSRLIDPNHVTRGRARVDPASRDASSASNPASDLRAARPGDPAETR